MRNKIIINAEFEMAINTGQCVFDIKNIDTNSKKSLSVKTDKNKFVGLINSDCTGRKMVIKNFYLSGLKRIIYKKYALAEYNNSLLAKKLGINVPEPILCYFSTKILPKQTTILMDYIDDSIIKQNNSTIDDRTLELIAETLISLYNVGANHIDLSPDNIFIQQDTGKITIIDWQYANFVKPKSVNQLIMQTSQLAQYLNRFYSTNINQFIQKLFLFFPKYLQKKEIINAVIFLKSKHLSKKKKFNV
jgi:RIO-like serine/threonine protein kinase